MALLFSFLLGDICVLLFISALLLLAYYKYQFSYWRRKQMPFLEPAFPYGNITSLINKEKNFAECFADMYQQAKPKSQGYADFHFMAKPGLLVFSPSIMKSILVKEFSSFMDRGLYTDEDSDPINQNLMFIHGERWKYIRSKTIPILTAAKLKLNFPVFYKPCNQLEEYLKKFESEGQPFPLLRTNENIVFDTITSFVFGIESNTLEESSEMCKYSHMYLDESLSNGAKVALSFMFPKIFEYFKIRMVRKSISDYFIESFWKIVEARKASGMIRNDLVDLLIAMDAEEKNGKGRLLKREEMDEATFRRRLRNLLAATSFNFLFGSWETVSSTLTFALLELSVNQDFQDKLRNEINEVLDNHDGVISYDVLMKMEFLQRVIFETLRKYPVAGVLNRMCNKTVHLPDFNLKIEAGTMVWIPVYGIQRDPEYFPDPDTFDPDRFLEEQTAPIFMPFGDGPKSCPGYRYGMVLVKLILVTYLKQFRYKMANGKNKIPKLAKVGFTNKPFEEQYLILEKI